MSGAEHSRDSSAKQRADARRILAQIPWPTEIERLRDQARRASRLNSEERFRAQLELLALVNHNPEALAAAKRLHDEQDEIERQRFREVIKRYEANARTTRPS